MLDREQPRARTTQAAGAPPTDERRFRVLVAGQATSMLGTSVSGVGVSVVAFLETGSVWWLSLLYLASRVPAVLVSTHAGAVADRADRRRLLLAADAAAGTATAAALGLHLLGGLALWHLLALAVVGSLANAYQEPAFQAAIPTLVAPDRLDRANGLVQLGPAMGMLAGPALAGVLVAWTGIGGILVVDLLTFAAAVAATTLVRFGSPAADPAPRTSTLAGLRASWQHLDGPRRGLRRLVLLSTVANLALSVVNVLLVALLVPLVGEQGLGLVLSLGGVAMLASTALVAARGLPTRRAPVVGLGFVAVGAGLVLVGLRPHVVPVTAGIVVALAGAPVVSAAVATLHHATVEPAWQGRIAALRRVSAEALVPVAVLLVAPLVESLAEPAMEVDGALADSVGRVLGVGPGRGVGLVVVAVGLVVALLGRRARRDPAIRALDEVAPADPPPITGTAVAVSR